MRTVLSRLLPFLLLAVAGLAAGCQPAAPTTAAPAPVRVQVTLANGGAAPNGQVVKVPRGAQVTVAVSSDRDDAVHVHGYDVELAVKAGETEETSFVADRPGRYEVETHHPVQTVVFLDVA